MTSGSVYDRGHERHPRSYQAATYDVVPSGSFTDPEYGRVGLTEAQAARQHDVVVGIARYDDLLRPFPQVWSYLGPAD